MNPVAAPEKHLPISLEEAVAELRRHPGATVHARLHDLDVELRAVATPVHAPEMKLGDWMASAGPWQGETEEEILNILRQTRRAGETSPLVRSTT